MKLLLLLLWPLAFASASASIYNFVPYTSHKYCLTMNGGYGENNGPFTLELCDPNSALKSFQQFTPSRPTTNVIVFETGHTPGCCRMCLDVTGGTGNNERVVQNICDLGSKTQYWVQTTATNTPLASAGYFWYKNLGTGRCMTAEGTTVDQYDCTSGALHQLWKIGTDAFLFGAPLLCQRLPLGLLAPCLQVVNGSPQFGAETVTATCSPTAFHQHFKVVTKTPTTWTLVGDGKCLDGGSGGGSPYQYDCYSTALNQQWLSFNYPKDGTTEYSYQMNTLSGLCLTWDPDNLPTVHHETCVEGNPNQQWQTPWVF